MKRSDEIHERLVTSMCKTIDQATTLGEVFVLREKAARHRDVIIMLRDKVAARIGTTAFELLKPTMDYMVELIDERIEHLELLAAWFVAVQEEEG